MTYDGSVNLSCKPADDKFTMRSRAILVVGIVGLLVAVRQTASAECEWWQPWCVIGEFFDRLEQCQKDSDDCFNLRDVPGSCGRVFVCADAVDKGGPMRTHSAGQAQVEKRKLYSGQFFHKDLARVSARLTELKWAAKACVFSGGTWDLKSVRCVCPPRLRFANGFCFSSETPKKDLPEPPTPGPGLPGPGLCRDNPVDPEPGHKWTARCDGPPCFSNADCPTGVNGTEGWCYGFEGKHEHPQRCLKLDRVAKE